MTSDHRVVGSSPAGCKYLICKCLADIKSQKHSSDRAEYTHLIPTFDRTLGPNGESRLSGFEVLLGSFSSICADNRAHFACPVYGQAHNSRLEAMKTTVTLTDENAAGLANLQFKRGSVWPILARANACCPGSAFSAQHVRASRATSYPRALCRRCRRGYDPSAFRRQPADPRTFRLY